MKHLKLAASASVAPYLQTARLVVDLRRADYADVAAIIISVGDLNHGRLAEIETLGFGIPAFVAVQGTEQVSPEFLPLLKGVITLSDANQAFYAAQIESAAHPLLPECRQDTTDAIIKHQADMGIAFDGDFDRCFLFDDAGYFIEGYYIVGLLADAFLEKYPSSRIIHDPRLSWNTIDIVTGAGGVPVMSKTGHAFIKERMRQEDAVYGGEMSAHHYFRDFYYCDSGMIPWLLVAELLHVKGKSLRQLINDRITAIAYLIMLKMKEFLSQGIS